MLALILVAVSVGLSNFAAAISIGISGTSTRTRLRVGIIFGLFETGMPIAGLALGRGLAQALGHSARWLSRAAHRHRRLGRLPGRPRRPGGCSCARPAEYRAAGYHRAGDQRR
jgi:hypothetical protein